MIYREVQRFWQPLMWAVAAIPCAILTWGVIQQIVLDSPWGNNPAPDWVLILLWFAVGIGLPALLLSLRLITIVSADGIDIRFRPLIGRTHIDYSEIWRQAPTTYRPVRDYGGWGVRWGGPRRWAFNVRGSEGVLIELDSGKSILVGSQRAPEMSAAIAANGGPAATA